MKQFFEKNKVIIFGLLSAIALSVNELFNDPTGVSTKVIVFSAFIAGLSFLANNLRGQWATISGIVGTAIATYVAMDQTGHIEWRSIITYMVISLLAVVAPPAKSRGYEHSTAITNAKQQGEAIQPTTLGTKK